MQRSSPPIVGGEVLTDTPEMRIELAGAGSSQPVGDNATADGAAANRRVTVLIMEGS